MPTLDEQVLALQIAFIELAKMLGREQHIATNQLGNALEAASKAAKLNAGAAAAVSALAKELK